MIDLLFWEEDLLIGSSHGRAKHQHCCSDVISIDLFLALPNTHSCLICGEETSKEYLTEKGLFMIVNTYQSRKSRYHGVASSQSL